MLYFIILQTVFPESGSFKVDVSDIEGGVTKIIVIAVIEGETLQPALTITVHGCAHPTTPPQPTTTPFESTTSPEHTTTPEPTTPKECYDEIGSVRPPSVTGRDFFEISFQSSSTVNGISFESSGDLTVVTILVEIIMGLSDNPVARVSLCR